MPCLRSGAKVEPAEATGGHCGCADARGSSATVLEWLVVAARPSRAWGGGLCTSADAALYAAVATASSPAQRFLEPLGELRGTALCLGVVHGGRWRAPLFAVRHAAPYWRRRREHRAVLAATSADSPTATRRLHHISRRHRPGHGVPHQPPQLQIRRVQLARRGGRTGSLDELRLRAARRGAGGSLRRRRHQLVIPQLHRHESPRSIEQLICGAVCCRLKSERVTRLVVVVVVVVVAAGVRRLDESAGAF